MRTLFVGDVHACARALDRVVTDANADRVFLVGDIFVKGPDPAGTWRIVHERRMQAVMGNHDAKLLDVWGANGDSVHHRAWPLLDEACREWILGLPVHREVDGNVLVHAGVHPYEGLPGTTRKMALTMRRWPDDVDLENPFWWQVYEGATRVIYGHDAMRGIQVHERTVGLDSGCVYGGQLTGWVLETGELFQSDREGNRVERGG